MSFAPNVRSIGQFYLDAHPALVYYYRFEQDDIQGTSILNHATGRYDALLHNGATISTSAGTYKVGSGALNLAAKNSAGTSPFVSITNGIMLGNTGLTFATW